MKKTFQLTHAKINYDRMADAVKHEIRKYIKRERKHTLPEGADFWDFDCKFGDTEEAANAVHLAELDAFINEATGKKQTSFYVEILAKPGHRTPKAKEVSDEAPKWVKKMNTFSSVSEEQD